MTLVMDEREVQRLVRIADLFAETLGALLGILEDGSEPEPENREVAWQMILTWETEGREAALANLHE